MNKNHSILTTFLNYCDKKLSFSFQKGDIFFIHNDLGDGWLWVTAHRTGEQGLVFRDLMAGLDDNIDPNAVFPWFHRTLTKNDAVELLVRGEKEIHFSHMKCLKFLGKVQGIFY